MVSIVREVDVSLSIDAQPRRFVETRAGTAAVTVTDAARSAREVSERISIGGDGREWESERKNGCRNSRSGSHAESVLLSRAAQAGNVVARFLIDERLEIGLSTRDRK
jgi:hypothetical protein